MVDTIKTTALTPADALANTDEVVVNQGGATKRGLLTQLATYIGAKLFGAWTDYSSTMTVATSVAAGSGFAVTKEYAMWKQVGKTVFVSGQVKITNLGSGPSASGVLSVTLPVNALYNTAAVAYESGGLGRGGVGYVTTGSAVLNLKGADGTSWVGLNYSVRFHITYEIA